MNTVSVRPNDDPVGPLGAPGIDGSDGVIAANDSQTDSERN
jgi:hypothetical protein